MKLMKMLPVVSSLFILSFSVGATTTSDDGVWFRGTMNKSFGKWLLQGSTDQRWMNNADQHINSQFTFLGGYQLTPEWSVWAGYSFRDFDIGAKAGFHESRGIQQVQWDKNFGENQFRSRSRLEERFFDRGLSDDYRYRQLLQWTHDFGKTNVYSILQNEIFFNLTGNNPGFTKSGFAENRAYMGIGYKFTPWLSSDIGYMSQYQSTAIPGLDKLNHILMSQININLDKLSQ